MSDADGKSTGEVRAGGAPKRLARLIPWLITAVCFTYLYYRLTGAAAREGLSFTTYLANVFAKVSWGHWLALMIPYSLFFFAIDSLIVWRVINWFNTRVRYGAILPIPLLIRTKPVAPRGSVRNTRWYIAGDAWSIRCWNEPPPFLPWAPATLNTRPVGPYHDRSRGGDE